MRKNIAILTLKLRKEPSRSMWLLNNSHYILKNELSDGDGTFVGCCR